MKLKEKNEMITAKELNRIFEQSGMTRNQIAVQVAYRRGIIDKGRIGYRFHSSVTKILAEPEKATVERLQEILEILGHSLEIV